MKRIFYPLIFFSLALTFTANAQFEINGQLVLRSEFKHGYGKLIPDTASPAFLIGHRLRLSAGYKSKNLHFYSSFQDVRTWGSTAQLNVTDGSLSLHEGWAEINLDSSWSLKLGRQELNYDNFRFLGNVDWALQGRSHDFALAKFVRKNHKLHIGAGYNQAGDFLSGNIYQVAKQYKTAQMIWYNYKKISFELSFLFWNNGKQSVTYDSAGLNIIDHKVLFSQTIGLPVVRTSLWKNNVTSGFVYYQMGKEVTDKAISAYDISLQTTQTLALNSETQKTIKFTLGAEILSGTKSGSTTGKINAFSPLYGTNHIHNGYMDYFFVSGRYENSYGLNDIFLKIRFDNKWGFVSMDIHNFSANAEISNSSGQIQKSMLGNEIDITGGWLINDVVSLQLGYSQMLPSSTLKYLQSSKASPLQNWAYAMLIIRPKSDKRFIGVLN